MTRADLCSFCGQHHHDCVCDDGEECPECGYYNCRCGRDDDDDWGGSHLDAAFDDLYWPTTRAEHAAEHIAYEGAGNANAYGRKLSPVGAPLGGYPWQRRIGRLRRMQEARRLARQTACGDEAPF